MSATKQVSETSSPVTVNSGEVVLYQPNEQVTIEVKMEYETVWLSQAQMVQLFDSTKQNISLHINNIFREGELDRKATVKEYLTVQTEGNRTITRNVKYYNLDVIISVGYRVKSVVGTRFRQWAMTILKEYMLRGYAVNQRLLELEQRIDSKFLAQHDEMRQIRETQTKQQEQIDFFVRTNLPPVEQVFFGGDFWEARELLEKLIKTATRRVVVIDQYIDATNFSMLDARSKGVIATIYSHKDFADLRDLHNAQPNVEPIETLVWSKPSHDRWLIIDDTVYHCGHSLKDMGKKMCAITHMGVDAEIILTQVQ